MTNINVNHVIFNNDYWNIVCPCMNVAKLPIQSAVYFERIVRSRILLLFNVHYILYQIQMCGF